MIFLIISVLAVLFFMRRAAYADEDNTEEIVEMIRDFLTEDDWHFNFDEENGLSKVLNGENIGTYVGK